MLLDEPTRLVFDEPESGLRTAVTLHPVGSGTLLRVHQALLPTELQTEQAARRLAGILDSLDSHLRNPTRFGRTEQ